MVQSLVGGFMQEYVSVKREARVPTATGTPFSRTLSKSSLRAMERALPDPLSLVTCIP